MHENGVALSSMDRWDHNGMALSGDDSDMAEECLVENGVDDLAVVVPPFGSSFDLDSLARGFHLPQASCTGHRPIQP
jgi:hypothetical protein